jgi:hypothetical protein
LSEQEILQWLFRNRSTGEITVAQAPNLLLWVVIISGIGMWVFPAGDASTVARMIFKGALFLWAADELLRGVNPWRRMLGGGVAAYELMTLFH